MMQPNEMKTTRKGKLDLTQTELAARLGLHTRTICAYEAGEMVIPPAIVLAMRALVREKKDDEARRAEAALAAMQ